MQTNERSNLFACVENQEDCKMSDSSDNNEEISDSSSEDERDHPIEDEDGPEEDGDESIESSEAEDSLIDGENAGKAFLKISSFR